ncbi:MAG: hypothetical protein A3J76_02470 [Candidatus Moranbacteria bacterium RBG_13_45_13]|nr:MAG: hypothetical protein A3J76_02470 [Candidatus Moranbacteria bacterium RBG_13_45_13]
MTKKIFAISTLLLVLVIGAIFVYNYAFKTQPSAKEDASDAKTASEGKLNEPADQADSKKTENTQSVSITAVSDEPVFGATLSTDGNSVYYFLSSNGQLNQVAFSGKLEKVLSTEKFENIKKVIWNKPKNKVIIKRESSPGKTKFLYFDISGKNISVLKENTDSVSWSNLGDKIIYKYFNPKTKKRTISVADPDGKNWRDMAEFSYQSVEISPVLGSSDISFWPSPNAYTATSVNTVSWSGENPKVIIKDRFGVDLLWSPNGARLVMSSSDQKGGHKIDLLLSNSDGGQIQSLMFPTFASKCVWSANSQFIFCAMPGNIPDSAILPNDWQEGKIKTSDTFWKIDVSTGKKERLVDPEKIDGSYDALYPFLSQDEKLLFFVSKSDGKLYKLAL